MSLESCLFISLACFSFGLLIVESSYVQDPRPYQINGLQIFPLFSTLPLHFLDQVLRNTKVGFVFRLVACAFHGLFETKRHFKPLMAFHNAAHKMKVCCSLLSPLIRKLPRRKGCRTAGHCPSHSSPILDSLPLLAHLFPTSFTVYPCVDNKISNNLEH